MLIEETREDPLREGEEKIAVASIHFPKSANSPKMPYSKIKVLYVDLHHHFKSIIVTQMEQVKPKYAEYYHRAAILRFGLHHPVYV